VLGLIGQDPRYLVSTGTGLNSHEKKNFHASPSTSSRSSFDRYLSPRSKNTATSVQGGSPGASEKRALGPPQRSVTSQLEVGARRYCSLAN
jgi:hypothetical protein